MTYNVGGGELPNTEKLPQFLQDFVRWVQENIVPLVERPEQHVATIVWIIVGFVLFLLLLGVITAFIRYVSEAAVIRMVDEYEQTGTKLGFRRGWKLGWSRAAFRMWVIDFILGLTGFVYVLILAGMGFAVFAAVTSGNPPLATIVVVLSILTFFVLTFTLIVGATFLGLLARFFKRSAALENTGIGASFRRGWEVFVRNWKSAVLMWLIMFGIGIGIGIVGIFVFFLLIPVFILLLVPAAVVAAIPGLIAYAITSLIVSPIAWLVGLIVGLPFFSLVVGAPLELIGGWVEVYTSSIWTLTYREMKALENVAPVPAPAPAG